MKFAATALAEWAKAIGSKPTQYESNKFQEGFRAGKANASSRCPYGIGDGNVSRAEWAWRAGFSAALAITEGA